MRTQSHPETKIQSPGFSKTIFCYVFVEFSVILLTCVSSFITLFLVIALIDNLEDFLKNDTSVGDIAQYYILQQPENLTHILPMSLIMATMYFITNLCKNNELTALRASGISISQSCLPITLLAMGLSVFNFINAEFLIPTCKTRTDQLKQRLLDPYQKRNKNEKTYLAFRNREKSRDWFFGNFNAAGKSQNINITQFREDNTIDWQLRAEEGRYSGNQWQFSGVYLKKFDTDGYLLIDDPEFHQSYSTPKLNEDPQKLSFVFNVSPMGDITMSSIIRILKTEGQNLSDDTLSVLKTYLYYNIFSPFSCMIAVFLGIPMAVMHDRGSNMKSFITAIAIMAMYYLLSQLFLVLGKNQSLPAIVAGAFPCLLFIGVGMWKMKKLF